jgi:hypothetical protein
MEKIKTKLQKVEKAEKMQEKIVEKKKAYTERARLGGNLGAGSWDVIQKGEAN